MSSSVASQRIADQVRERILNGTLAPGARILQDELAEELNASRLPVREALRILQSSGLVLLKSNKGAWVTRLDQRECELNYQIRERLEPLLLAESMRSTTPADVEELVAIQERIEAIEHFPTSGPRGPSDRAGREAFDDDVETFLVLDRQLHWATYRRHDAPELAQIVARLWDTTQHYRRAFTSRAWADHRWTINSEHRLLIGAIRDGNVEIAQRVLEIHIRRTRTELLKHPDVFDV